jgi:pimeloyl-ACP methyl ester carboxylesterase
VGLDGALDDLTAFLAARDDAERDVAPAMRSQVHRGEAGAGVVVLVHGLTASPPAWRAIAAALVARGRTVVVPRLLYHGYADRMTRVLRRLTPEALIADTRAIIERVCALGEAVTVAGHSLGATLAIDAVLNGPPVARIVPIAPFLGIAGIPLEVHPLLVTTLQRVPGVFLWWDPVLRERLQPEHGYPRYPLCALATGIRIADAARASARRAPPAGAIDLVINARESSVNNRTAVRLARSWRAAQAAVSIHQLTGLGWSHDIIEPERPVAQIAQAVLTAIIAGLHEPGDRTHALAAARLL